MTMSVKQGGVWNPVTGLYTKQGGVWQSVQTGYVKQGGWCASWAAKVV